MATVSKSYWGSADPIVSYCAKHTVKLHPLQQELHDKTLKEAKMSTMLGAPEVLTVGSNFIELINGKKVLDVGTYTGASALAWALAAGDDAQIYTFDIDHSNYKQHGVPVISKCEKTFKKIIPVEGPAVEELDKLIADGQSGTFDFAFIDADKNNYSNYYDRIVKLLRKGGVILVDNSLWSGRVVNLQPGDESSAAIDAMNKHVFADDKTASALLNCGDGLHIAFKK